MIKPFKVQPKLPENFFGETWEKLRSAIQAVYFKNTSSISKEELYRAVEDLCVQKFAAQLYENLSREIESASLQKVQLMRSATSLDAIAFLSQVESIWSDHCEQLSTIRNIFLYLDRCVSLLLLLFCCRSLFYRLTSLLLLTLLEPTSSTGATRCLVTRRA